MPAPANPAAAAAQTALVIIMPIAIVTRVYGLIFITVMGVQIIAAMVYVRIVVKLNRVAQRIVMAAAANARNLIVEGIMRLVHIVMVIPFQETIIAIRRLVN